MVLPPKEYLQKTINNAIQEDIGDGDHTSLACIPINKKGKAELLAKETGIIAGIELAELIFEQMDQSLVFRKKLNDGSNINDGDIVFTIDGSVLSILKAERIVLNFMQRMSGIATATHHIVSSISGTNTKILDTRKTTPGLRLIEKWAVQIGGGTNHRVGLFDMVMIKDNHIDYAGGIPQAIKKVKDYLKTKGKDLKIEIEARSLNEVREILSTGGVDRIMLDNFDFESTKQAVSIINGACETESSGNITLETALKYANCGVDYISVGAITHSVKSIDLSLKAVT